MTSVWDASVRSSLLDRAGRLKESTTPAWGKMNASGMMAHLNDSYRMALGDLKVKSKDLPLRYPVIKQLVVYALPWPKGAPTAPELIARCDGAVLSDEHRAYVELMSRLGAVGARATLADHPAFGSLTHRAYGVLIARHTDHHLRQFGL